MKMRGVTEEVLSASSKATETIVSSSSQTNQRKYSLRQVKMTTTSSGNRMEFQGAQFLLSLLIFLVCSVYYILEALVLTLIPLKYRTDPHRLRGQIALVTGGAGGVGRHLCVKLAQRGAKVVIWDLNKASIDETIHAVQAVGGTATGFVCDISKRENVYKCAEMVRTKVGKVDVVINNAAITHCRSLFDISDDEIAKSYDINILAHYWIVKAFLPDMIATERGHIVTVASMAGIVGVYRCTDYSATKFAACGFHESLYSELQMENRKGVDLSLVCPYYINTPMFRGVKPRLQPMLEPEWVAEKIVIAILKRENFVILPNSLRWFFPLKFILPAKMCWALNRDVMQVPQSMMTFEGSSKTN